MGEKVENRPTRRLPKDWEEAKQEIRRTGDGIIDLWIDDWPKGWGSVIKMWREAQNYSASKAALQVGVSPATWIRWENSETQPSDDNKEQLVQLLKTGDVIDGTSNATREFIRMLEGEPHVKVKEMLDKDNWIGLLGVRDPESPGFELLKTIYEDNFQHLSLWSDDPVAVRIGKISSCAGYAIARFKHAADTEKPIWMSGAKSCIYDLIAMKKACKGSEWERTFGKAFLGGYALGMEDAYAQALLKIEELKRGRD